MKRDLINKPEGEYSCFIDDDDYLGNDEDKNNDGGNFLRGCLVLIAFIAIVTAVIIGICELV